MFTTSWQIPARRWVRASRLIALAGLCGALARAQEPAPEAPAGYLFAHMTKGDYGRLYYALSRDGRHWTPLNGGRRVLDAYLGHPDICRGHDGRFYMVGVQRVPPKVGIWVSSDLLAWDWLRDIDPAFFDVEGHLAGAPWRGAPKLFWDDRTGLYLLTWHASNLPGSREDTEQYWRGQRTFASTSQDLADFTPPRRLFPDWDFATIDVIVRHQGERYVAIIKDERYPDLDCPTGKTIRVATSDHLLGPYGPPSAPISTNFREAPAVIPRPDGRGWYLYAEQYPGVSYSLLTAPALDGAWHEVYWENFQVTPGARHGGMIALTADECARLERALGPAAP
jgi:hypothetical protein